MQFILSCAVVAVLSASAVLFIRYGRLILNGPNPTRFFSFFAILFTSGLDVGLIMLPLGEFPVYEADSVYDFTNPLALEFGFWGFTIWLFYFLTTFYFCVIEPRLKIFEIPLVKLVNCTVIIATCAFTGFLFLQNLPDFVRDISPTFRFGLVGLAVLAAVLSSTDVRYIKILSLGSTWLFFALVAAMWSFGGLGIDGLARNLGDLSEYFTNIHRFVLPMSDYHAFYLFWWFSWSIMIGQFVARFVNGLQTWQLLIALLAIPSIPIALWFSVLFGIYDQGVEISALLNACMVIVGILFVVNSLDSLMRLYTESLNLTVERLGTARYVGVNWLLLFGLILLYQFTPLQIEWIGLVVIGLYALVAYLIFHRSAKLSGPLIVENQRALQESP